MARRRKTSDNEYRQNNENVILSLFFKLCIVIIAVVLALAFVFNVYLSSLPPIKNLQTYKPNMVTQIYSSDKELIKTFTTYNSQTVTLNKIPKYLIDAIISTEDKNFYKHKGYDIFGLARSVLVNVKAKRMAQGASTITQQLARILFLSNEKTFTRKISEIKIAAQIEKTISKDKILEMYLNNVYLGSGAYGVAAAASTYFGKDLSELSLAECALIAGLPQAPSVYSPYNNMDLAIKRRNQVLLRMYKMRTITKKQYDEALKQKVKLNPNPSFNVANSAPYFIDFMLEELEVLGFDRDEITNGGYKITTTLNYKAQKAANAAILNGLKSWGMTNQKHQAALFSFSPITGAIIAYSGGKNYSISQYDRIKQAVRPPGSSFKPFVYATAINKGWAPTDMIDDKPVKIGDWQPQNYGGVYRGTIPLYRALALSSNVAAVRLIQELGARSVMSTAKTLGITTPLENDLTIALGSNGVKLYEMVIAFGAFANGGFKVEPYAVERVETSRGKVIYQAPKTRITKVLDVNTAAILTAMMKEVILHGTGRAADIGKPMAGKTGTTDDYKDAWFIGYTPDIVTGVWVGNDDNSKMGNLTGGTVPAIIWKNMMKTATESYSESDFDYPPIELKADYVEKKIVLKKGQLMPEDEETENSENNDSEMNEQEEVDLKPVHHKVHDPLKDSFKSIPVQLNLPIEHKSYTKTETEIETEEPVMIRTNLPVRTIKAEVLSTDD